VRPERQRPRAVPVQPVVPCVVEVHADFEAGVLLGHQQLEELLVVVMRLLVGDEEEHVQGGFRGGFGQLGVDYGLAGGVVLF
jgi:hypothetical protein